MRGDDPHTSHMLLIADLIIKVENLLTRRLNTILEAEGLGPVDHVMQTLNRLKNKFINKKKITKRYEELYKGF